MFLGWLQLVALFTLLIDGVCCVCVATAGPLVSGLVNRYGCRAVCIAGAFVGGAGFVLSTFATSVKVMYVTIGLVLGECRLRQPTSILHWKGLN